MGLRDELQDLIAQQVAATRAGEMFVQHGKEALAQSDLGLADVVDAFGAALNAHREAILRLADEIDEMAKH